MHKINWIKVKKSNKEINKLLCSNLANCIIDGITREFVRHDKRIAEDSLNYEYYNEIRGIVLESFWRAIKEYEPMRGKFTTYASYVCRRDVQHYLKSKYAKVESSELFEDVACVEIENNIVNHMTLNSILNRMGKRNRERLEFYYLNNPSEQNSQTWKTSGVKHIIKSLKISKFKFYNRINEALAEARSYACDH